MRKNRFHLKVLDKKREEILAKLAIVSDFDFYLGEGTALALQIGHRTSLDFDFYKEEQFVPKELFELLQENLGKKVVFIRDTPRTLIVEISGVEASFFYYPYKLLQKPLKVLGVKIASLSDIAGMKAVAIGQRGRQRDYVDIYYLLKHFGVEKLLKLTQKKYPNFEIYHVLVSLTYFEEAEKDKQKERFIVFDKSLTWSKVKDDIFRQVKTYQLSFAKRGF